MGLKINNPDQKNSVITDLWRSSNGCIFELLKVVIRCAKVNHLEGVEGWYREGAGLGPVDNPVYTGLLS